jgi:hypothetical protein
MWRIPWPRSRQPPCTHRSARPRPSIEVLENRCLPSLITVVIGDTGGVRGTLFKWATDHVK